MATVGGDRSRNLRNCDGHEVKKKRIKRLSSNQERKSGVFPVCIYLYLSLLWLRHTFYQSNNTVTPAIVRQKA